MMCYSGTAKAGMSACPHYRWNFFSKYNRTLNSMESVMICGIMHNCNCYSSTGLCPWIPLGDFHLLDPLLTQ